MLGGVSRHTCLSKRGIRCRLTIASPWYDGFAPVESSIGGALKGRLVSQTCRSRSFILIGDQINDDCRPFAPPSEPSNNGFLRIIVCREMTHPAILQLILNRSSNKKCPKEARRVRAQRITGQLRLGCQFRWILAHKAMSVLPTAADPYYPAMDCSMIDQGNSLNRHSSGFQTLGP